MFDSSDVKKRKLDAAYAKGIAKAQGASGFDSLAEGLSALVMPDSMGTEEYQSYKRGYHEAMKSGVKTKSAAGKPDEEISLDALTKAWYALCNSSEFIPEERVAYYRDRLQARGDAAAFAVGLSDFTQSACPKCGASGQYKVHFLGQFKHPTCGTEWYMSPGSYIVFQLASVFHTGIRAGGAMKDDRDRNRKGDGWLMGILGFYFAAMFRLILAFVLIPIQAVVSLTQSKSKQ